jgi:hypothetical protein
MSCATSISGSITSISGDVVLDHPHASRSGLLFLAPQV